MKFAPLSLTLLTAPQSHEPQLIDLDGTFFIQLGVLFVLMLLLTRLLWKPYLKVRSERVSRVEGYREQAAKLEADAQQRLERAEGALAEARRVGAGERSVARAEAHAREQTLLAQAGAAAQKALAEARARIATTVAAERGKLEANALATAREAARKILGREVSA
jgi:F-type H+-transporting ATPase subunit b